MKFSIAINMSRNSPSDSMSEEAAHALDLVRMADEGGFEIVWAAEHHGVEYTTGPNPLLILTHWAGHTSQIRLGTAVIVAPYWHPIRAAGEIALTDLYSDGRLEIGFGRGAFQYEFDRMTDGLQQQEGRKYLAELIPAVKQLWAGDYEHNGDCWQFPRATSVPKPVQKPHPPLWVASRDPESFEIALSNGCNVMTTPLGQPFGEVENLGEKLAAAMKNHPGLPRPRWLVLRGAFVYEDPAALAAYQQASHSYGAGGFAALFSNKGQVVNGFALPDDSAPAPPPRRRDDGADQRTTVIGTPEEVVEQLRAYEALGVDSFCYSGNTMLAHDVSRRSLELFVSEVMPHFRSDDPGDD